MEQPGNLHSESVYEITIRGQINQSWLVGFGKVDLRSEHLADGAQLTHSKIVTDQAGIVGLIRRLHGLGVVLVSMRQMSAAN